MIKTNLTGADISITHCVADHWDELGDHEYGDYSDCVPNTTVAAKNGGIIVYDLNEANGQYLADKATNKGLT
tara:strand:+ start:1845 stop:2060 length:216 start_codon:yes stop_codon:yes gene_type:complete